MNSAVAIAAAVRNGSATAAEIVTTALEEVASSQTELNAFTSVDGTRAIDAANALDAAVARGEDPGPLAGVPVAIKDIIDHVGWTTTCGSSFYKHEPTESAPVVARLEAAGAIVVGRTGLHEFAFGYSSENEWWGPVRNPWDVATSPGGSSGGSGAAVGAGLVPIALGTDTGGSVRVPAALCGVLGLKVTHGRVPLHGVFPLAASLDTVGPIARTPSDLGLAFQAIAGHHPVDPWSYPEPVFGQPEPIALDGLRVGIPVQWAHRATTDDVAEGFRRFLDGLSDAGARVEEVHAPSVAPSTESEGASYPEIAAVHRNWFTAHPEAYGGEVRGRLEETMRFDLDDYIAGLRWRAGVRAAAATLFRSYDVLVTPAVGAMKKHIGVDTIEIDGTDLPYRPVLAQFASLVNHIGSPSLVAPVAGPGSPPPAVQVTGPWWSETMLIALAETLDAQNLIAVSEPPRA